MGINYRYSMPYVKLRIPMRIVSPNRTEHWTKTAKRRKKQHQVVSYLLRTQQPIPYLPCKVTLTRISPRPYDSDNLQYSFKGIRDSVADWIIPGKKRGLADSDPRIQWEYDQIKGDVGEHAILIVITATDKII